MQAERSQRGPDRRGVLLALPGTAADPQHEAAYVLLPGTWTVGPLLLQDGRVGRQQDQPEGEGPGGVVGEGRAQDGAAEAEEGRGEGEDE